jgi:hypothetical protein
MGDDEMPTQLPSPSQVSAFPLPYGLPINGQAGRLIKSRHALEIDSYARDGPASMGAQIDGSGARVPQSVPSRHRGVSREHLR